MIRETACIEIFKLPEPELGVFLRKECTKKAMNRNEISGSKLTPLTIKKGFRLT